MAALSVLFVLSVAQFLIALDYSIIYVALPSIAGDLGLAPAAAQWVVSAYAVLFAGFLVVGGRLVDRYGVRRLFVLAIVAFGLASAIGGAAQNGTALLAARAGQGLAAAVLQPAVLGLIGTTFPAGPVRARAVAVWGSVGAVGLAAGAILGGVLTTASWRLTFIINVPLTLLCALGALRGPADDRERTGRIPLLATLVATGTVLALVLGLTLGADRGWRSPLTMASLGLALIGLVAFVRGERSPGPVLIEPVLRRIPTLRAGALATALYMASVGSEFYLLTLLLQGAKDYSPLQAGLAFLPLAVLVTVGSTSAGRAVRRFDPATVLAAGFLIAAAGLLWLTLGSTGSYPAGLLPGLLLSGYGHGIIYTSMFIIGTRDAPATHQGMAGALLTTSQYLAGAVTIAVLTLVLGAAPGTAGVRVAFLITAVAAVAGVLLAVWIRPRACPGSADRSGPASPRRRRSPGTARPR